jgi:hypothetical protein
LKIFRPILLILFTYPLFAQFEGPAVLSRGESPTTMTETKIKFRPYVGLSGTYSTGLSGVGLSNTGELANVSSYGATLNWGVGGLHLWKRGKLGLDYAGSVSHYSRESTFDSVGQTFMMAVTQQLSRHIEISIRESAGVYSRNFGLLGLSQSLQYDPTRSSYIPKTDYFDNRTAYSSTQADVMIVKSSRLTFDLGGDIYIARRRSSALNGNTGVSAHGDVQRRMTRMTTIGGGYRFEHQTFTRTYGGAFIHSFYGSYARQLSRHVELTAFGGIAHFETTFVQLLPVDPAIAALLGATSSAIVSHQVRDSPTGGVRLSRIMKNGNVYISMGRSVSPGNGLFLTSDSTTADVGYTFTAMRRWSMTTHAEWSRSRALGTYVGEYSNRSAGAMVARQITPGIQATSEYSIRKYSSGDYQQYNRTIQEVSVGIRVAAGTIPLKVW